MKTNKTIITISLLASLSLAGLYYGIKNDKHEQQSLFRNTDSLFKAENIKALPSSSLNTKNQVKALPSSDSLKPIVNYSPNEKSISRNVAIKEFNKGNYYESIVSEGEGFRSQIYNDNIGYAIGNGWNVSLQTLETNQRIAKAIGLSPADTTALTAMSGMQRPKVMPSVAITPEQATKASQLMRNQFEQPMRRLVPSFDHLKPNEQAALVYHAYKVGLGGAAKYTGMLSALRSYDANPSDANRLKVADSFTYTYRMNGKVYTDNRSKLFLAALFSGPASYGYLLGTTPAPANFSGIAKLANQKIDTSKSADEQVQDDFGKAKEEILRSGRLPEFKQEFRAVSGHQQNNGYWY